MGLHPPAGGTEAGNSDGGSCSRSTLMSGATRATSCPPSGGPTIRPNSKDAILGAMTTVVVVGLNAQGGAAGIGAGVRPVGMGHLGTGLVGTGAEAGGSERVNHTVKTKGMPHPRVHPSSHIESFLNTLVCPTGPDTGKARWGNNSLQSS